MKKKVETIDITPKWSDLIHLFEDWLTSGSTAQRALAKAELVKLANIADALSEHKKHGGLTCKCGENINFAS